MPDSPLAIHYGPPTRNLDSQKVIRSRWPFQETLGCLKEAINAEDLWLIHEINPQDLLARGGFSALGLRQLLFFHPRYLARLLEGDPSALVEVPLKLAVLEMPNGEVSVRCPEPLLAFRRYPNLAALGLELDQICQRLLIPVGVPEA